MRKVFITGVGGCVGHYLFEELSRDPSYQLYLLIRNSQKLRFNPGSAIIIQDDLKNIEKHADVIGQADQVIHLATDWGEKEGNYDYTLALFNLLDPAKCKKVIYFSTASILGPDDKPIPEAEKFGTHYIRSKYRFFRELPKLKIFPNVITLFPTWILGGDEKHPYSHASEGILALRKWLWLIRFFTVDASFHFIHARDVAKITKYLLENETKEKEFVLGNAPVTASQFVKETCRYFGMPVYFQIPIGLPVVQFLAFLTGRKLHSWDLFCFNRRHFTHKTANARSFGIESNLETIGDALRELNSF